MQKQRYALVGYVKSSAGEFVENLRRELHPDLPGFSAHLTILPPRTLQGTEREAIQLLERICGEVEPFEVSLGGVDTFIPVTPTVFVRVDASASRMHDLHGQLNTEALAFHEEWPYSPHMTIAKLSGEQAAQDALVLARQRWAEYSGSRRVLLEKLSFVREEVRDDGPNCWVDVAPVILGRRLVSK